MLNINEVSNFTLEPTVVEELDNDLALKNDVLFAKFDDSVKICLSHKKNQ